MRVVSTPSTSVCMDKLYSLLSTCSPLGKRVVVAAVAEAAEEAGAETVVVVVVVVVVCVVETGSTMFRESGVSSVSANTLSGMSVV